MREAIAKAKERFQERCTGCKVENEINERAAALKRIGVKANHTCHGDLAAVRDVALAALQETRRRFSCASSGANLAWGFEVLDEVEADLKHRLLPEGSEGGKE